MIANNVIYKPISSIHCFSKGHVFDGSTLMTYKEQIQLHKQYSKDFSAWSVSMATISKRQESATDKLSQYERNLGLFINIFSKTMFDYLKVDASGVVMF